MGDLIGLVADALTIVLSVVALSAPVLARRPAVRRYLLLGAIKRSLRGTAVGHEPAGDAVSVLDMSGGAASPAARERGRKKQLGRYAERLSAPIEEMLRGEDLLPVDVLSRFLAGETGPGAAPDGRPGPTVLLNGPMWHRAASAISEVARRASAVRTYGLLVSLLLPREVDLVRSTAKRLAEHLRPFDESDVLVQDARGWRSPFADFASRISGAQVLVDGSGTRSGSVDSVIVWHARRYWPVPTPQGYSWGDYQDQHPMNGPGDGHPPGFCDFPRPSDWRPGDFDRRVLMLQGVSLAIAPRRGRMHMVLQTAETCYLATEQADTVGCKHLRDQEVGPFFEVRPRDGGVAQGAYRPLGSPCDADPRVVLLTSYVSFVTCDGSVLLARRSGRVKHGQGVLSASAGGIIEPSGDGPDGDVDANGMPDPAVCAAREAAEELGVDVDPATLRPAAVFLANIRNRDPHDASTTTSVTEHRGLPLIGDARLTVDPSRLVTAPPEVARRHGLGTHDPSAGSAPAEASPTGRPADRPVPADGRGGKGQVVAVVLFLAHVEATAEQIRAKRETADAALGRYETDDHDPLFEVARRAGESFSQAASRVASEHRDSLDQHGLLTLLYASAHLDGPDAALRTWSDALSPRGRPDPLPGG